VFGVLVDKVGVIERTSAAPCGEVFNQDSIWIFFFMWQAKRHARWRWSGPARALDAFADLDRVREHTLDVIEPHDQVARSELVGFCQQIGFDLLG
jgi:hypothetical protein